LVVFALAARLAREGRTMATFVGFRLEALLLMGLDGWDLRGENYKVVKMGMTREF